VLILDRPGNRDGVDLDQILTLPVVIRCGHVDREAKGMTAIRDIASLTYRVLG